MTSKFLKLAAIGLVGLAMGTGLAQAGAADDAIKARQGCMKANGGAMKGFGAIAKGEAKFDAAAVAEAVGKIEAACGGWANWWGADTQKGETVETSAKPEIWTDAEGWKAAEAAYGPALAAVKAATDDASFKEALGKFGGSCKGCHEKFRQAKQ